MDSTNKAQGGLSDVGLEGYSESSSPSKKTREIPTLAKAINEFAFRIYNEEKKAGGNVLISPINIALCLITVWSGADGQTAREVAETLMLTSMDCGQASAEMSLLLESILDAQNLNMYLINKVYMAKGIQVKKPFKKMCSKSFKLEMEELDFTQVDTVRKVINQMVEKKSKGIYKDYMEPYHVGKETKLLFISATCLRASWFKSFDETATKKGKFVTEEGKTVEVNMLNGIFQFKYHIVEVLGAKGITLTFWDESFQMIILLPNDPGGLSKMEQRLADVVIKELTFSLRTVQLTVPKFRIEKSHPIKHLLSRLGVPGMFRQGANLSNIFSEPTFADNYFHTLFFGISERGTSEDIKSGETVPVKPQGEPTTFTVDRPFVFIVKKQAAILFVGRVTNPSLT